MTHEYSFVPSVKNMRRINVEEAVNTLRTFLEQVSQGEEIILVEQDQEVARLVPSQNKDQ